MRCFIGIQLPSKTKDTLYEVQQKIGNEYAKIRWVAKKNLHLTLKFLGYVNEEQLKLTREVLSNVKVKKFIVNLGGVSWFPSEERIRVIWVDLNPKKDILNLQGDIELKLGGLFEKDERFTTHLTVGRVKSIINKKKFLKVLGDNEVNADSFLVGEFCLIQSRLSRDGPVYNVLETYKLI